MKILKKILVILIVIAVIVIAGGMVGTWYISYKPNVKLDKTLTFYVYPDDEYEDVIDELCNQDAFKSQNTIMICGMLNKHFKMYNHIETGCYQLKPGMRNIEVVRMLYNGWQTPIRFVVNNMRLPEDFAASVGRQLMIDSLDMMNLIDDSTVLVENLGLSYENLFEHILENTYEVYWNISAEDLLKRLIMENDKFWNENRKAKAERLGLTPSQVCIIASIVDEESHYKPELPVIAGLYINRLRIGMPLQSCPTVKYAQRDFLKTRVLDKDLLFDSPYNTYKYKGLPPGPIRLPLTTTIDAVLNADMTHNYIYMCADASFNGRHRFAVTLAEHNRNAADYHRALNKLSR